MTAAKVSSRWTDDDDEEDVALASQRKKEKEEKKRAKANKQRVLDQAAERQREEDEAAAAAQASSALTHDEDADISLRPAKRRRLSPDRAPQETTVLRFPAREWNPARSVENYDKLNDIEEGAYGWVSRARELATGQVVALKRLKMENAADGVPVTGLREIQTLMACHHENIVTLREVVVGENTEKIDSIFLVLDFLEHDLKTLLASMSSPFLTSEVKTLLHQLLSGLAYLHAHYILHRDLKTSNLLLSNAGILKIADFGMARYTSDPAPPALTPLVVTLWYRAPELLLGAAAYGPAIDLWSVGCIFAELVTNEPQFQGTTELDQLTRIFRLCGLPTEAAWPGYKRLPNARSLRLPPTSPIRAAATIRATFPFLSAVGAALLTSLLALNPGARPTAADAATHAFFTEHPRMKSTRLFPTFPSKAALERRRTRIKSPVVGARGAGLQNADAAALVDFAGIFCQEEEEEEEVQGAGFSLKMI